MPFNDDTQLEALMTSFITKHNVDVIIETGTYHGHTTEYFAKFNKTVIATEISEENAAITKERVKEYNNVKLYLGDSTSALKEILPQYSGKKVFFFLDSHDRNDLSLQRELDLIHSTNIVPYITIHDFYVPGTSLGYDHWDGVVYEFNTLKPYFDKVYKKFKGYKYNYNDDTAVGSRRGCIFLEPLIYLEPPKL